MAEKKLSNTEVLSLLSRFETEWTQFRGMWDQLMPSFQHMSAVVARYQEISAEMPQMEEQHRSLSLAVENRKRAAADGKNEIEKELAQYREHMEQELLPLKNELDGTREKVFAIQHARTEAERSFEERKRAQEFDLRELEERLTNAQRMLTDIGRLTGAIHAG